MNVWLARYWRIPALWAAVTVAGALLHFSTGAWILSAAIVAACSLALYRKQQDSRRTRSGR